MTVLNESGTPDVLPPLHAVNGLAQRTPGALTLVLGARSEAFIVQSIPAPSPPGYASPPRSPRVSFMVLDPAHPPEKGYLASRIVEAAAGFRGLEGVFLVSGKSAEVIGVDPVFESRLAARRLEMPVCSVIHDAPHESPGVLSTDLEDRFIAAMLELCPEQGSSDPVADEDTEKPSSGGLFGGLFGGRGRERAVSRETLPVVLVGSFGASNSAREISSDLRKAGVRVEGVVPSARLGSLPGLGEGTVVGLLDPNLPETARVARERGATVARTLFPIGVDGTARFIQDVAREAGGEATNEVGRARSAWQELSALRNRIRGKRVFLAGDTGLEVPLARFLTDAGAVVLEVGAPRLDRRALADELQALGPDVDVVESPDWRGQIDRVERTRPDIVLASRGIYGPLVARGCLCRYSQDLTRLGVQGYSGARRALELLDRTFERAEGLDASVNL